MVWDIGFASLLLVVQTNPEMPSPEAAAPVLTAAALAELAPFGTERTVEAGDILFRAGDASYDFMVVLEGEVEIVRPDRESEAVLATRGAGQFLGELNLLTGQRLFLTGAGAQAGRILAIPSSEFRRLMAVKPDLADTIFSRLLRPSRAPATGRGRGVRCGSSGRGTRPRRWRCGRSPPGPSSRTRGSTSRTSTTSTSCSPASGFRAARHAGRDHADRGAAPSHARRVRRAPRPHVPPAAGIHVRSGRRRERPGRARGRGLRRVRGARHRRRSTPWPREARPARARGSRTTSASRTASRARSSRPRAAIQAQRLGAQLNAPCEVAGLRVEHGFHVIVLADGSEIPCRTVIVASGARYQRLAVDDLERFEGAGVYYAATDLEARMCTGLDVIVVGGGNSAGQAAIYLAQQGSRVSIAIRRDDLTAQHVALPDRADRGRPAHRAARPAPRCARSTATSHLERVTLEHTPTGERRDRRVFGTVLLHRRRPRDRDGCDDVLELDAKGFILTDRALPDSVIVAGPCS